jgi:membrane protein implicated in regulation of membrane protease activity
MAALFARLVDLPAAFVAGLSFLSGWPGIILMIVVVPVIVRSAGAGRRFAPRALERPDEVA